MAARFMLYYVLVFTFFDYVILDESACGKPLGEDFRLHEEDRIVSGYDIGYYRYPWYAALIRYKSVSCGGALIAPKTVLTAAHCYKEFLTLAQHGGLTLESIFTVRLGIYNICINESTQKEYSVEKVNVHELYQQKMPYYDICLLKLVGNTDQYRPICLPPPTLKKKPLYGTVPGLGTLRYRGAMPCTVHEARLLFYNDSMCHDMINKTGNDASIIENAFCAGYIQGGIDTCQGDSGGPLQSMNQNGNYVVIGIVSFGFRCAVPGVLGMYTDVSKYINWINEKTGIDAPTIVNSFQEKPVDNGTNVNNVHTGVGSVGTGGGHRPHHHWIHIIGPYRRPIKILLDKNKRPR
ncbi:clotting factor G beta subunit-like [Diorhabda sublineata]|uniref:clotting factor G beta subunit-like n=1 Tax=Diorhabda sublineata TaxID=1163346 RepID=UPI0024E1161C|nr:clotting factor G beta subunit-like [Diorhabda sublineata]